MRFRYASTRLLVILSLSTAFAFSANPLNAADATKRSQARGSASIASHENTGLPNVELRPVKLPTAPAKSNLCNPIDRLMSAPLRAQGLDLTQVVPDRVFVRRVFLDLVGLLPTPAELDAFVRDS